MYLSLDWLRADDSLCVAHGENVKHV
jgi:hypothetical protein